MVILLVVILIAAVTVALPPAAGRVISSEESSQLASDFLIKFGYIKRSHLASGALRSRKLLREAIVDVQRFGKIPQTGIIDNATLILIGRKRCGVPDRFETEQNSPEHRMRRYALQGSKWEKTDLTWSVKHWPRNIDPKVLRLELAKALGVWSEVSKLTFTETRQADADIVISFLSGSHGDNYAFDGPGNVLAHAFFPGEAIGGDAHFDADEKWVRQGVISSSTSAADRTSNSVGGDAPLNEEGVNLFGVAAHEFGHSLGLKHSSVASSLMYPYYKEIKEDFKLPYDDTVGIQQLYGSKFPDKWAPLPPLPTSPPTMSPRRPQEPPREPSNPDGRPPVTPTRPGKPLPPFVDGIPQTCNTTFDAISSIRREVFFFKDKYFWRLTDNKRLERAYPIEINHFWYNLPKDLKKVDAVYERPQDRKIVFFIGKMFYVYSGNNPDPGNPIPLTYLGLPDDLERIDAAMVWGHNGRTYLFSGSNYWRLEESGGRAEPDYPRDIRVWKGAPRNMDAAFQWHRNGITYFFKNDLFWEFNNRKMIVSRDSPHDSLDFWFESVCNGTVHSRSRGRDSGDMPSWSDISSACKMIRPMNPILLMCALIFIVVVGLKNQKVLF